MTASADLTPADYLKKILTARVYDVAVESPLEPARALSARLGNTVAVCRKCYIHPAVIEAFAGDPRVTMLTLLNRGKASALNTALEQVTGEVVVALDADTQFEPATIARLARWFADPAVGAVAGAHRTGLEPALAAYLNATASNAVSVAIRCGVTGQRDGVGVLAGLEGTISAVAACAARGSLDDLGSAAIMADIASLRHETLHSRLFRS